MAAVGARLLSAGLLDRVGGRDALVTDGLARAQVDRALDVGLWLLHVAVALGAATLWRLVVGRGPLETVTTTLSTQVARAPVRT